MTNTIVTLSPDFTIYGSIGETATTTSSRYQLPYDANDSSRWQAVLIQNGDLSKHVHFKLGDNTVVADADSTIIKADGEMTIHRNNHHYIAFWVDSGTAEIIVTTGEYGVR